jgi:hypothetical protein
MPRELIQARADADTVERIEEYAEERDISRSEAIRRLLRTGLDAEEGAAEQAGERYALANISPAVRLAGGVLMVLAILFLLLSELGVL